MALRSVRRWALSLLRPSGVRAGARGELPSFPRARGMRAVGARHQPGRARSCELALRAVGAAQGRLEGGAASYHCEGCAGSGTLPGASSRPWGRRPGPAARFPSARGLWAWGPVTEPTAHTLASCCCGLWGQHKRARREGAPHLREGCLGLGTLPPLSARHWGRRPGPAARLLCARGMSAWGPVMNPTAHALASWLCALRGCHKGARRKAPPASVRGVQGWALSLPQCSVLDTGGRGPLLVSPGRRGCGRGDPSASPQRTLLGAGFARCGGGTRAHGGGASCLRGGSLGWGTLPSPAARPWGVRTGPLPVFLGRGGRGCGDLSPIPQRTLLGAGFARCRAGRRALAPRILWCPKIPKPAKVRNTTFFVKLYHKEHIFRS